MYSSGTYKEVVDWGWGPGVNFRVGPSTYYAAKCLRYGKGVPMNIYQAKYLFQKTLEFSKAQEFGYKEASEELAGIDKIEQPIQLKTGLKPAIDRWLADSDELEDLAKDGDIEAITIYCYRTMMMSWVLYYNDGITKRLFGDKEAVDMLPMLLAAAPNEVTCQLILAIIYAGPEAMGLNRDFTYSFRDPEKAKYWLEKFCSNPKRSDAFYWSKKYEVDDIIIPNIRGMK